jgi:hypothetical protein
MPQKFIVTDCKMVWLKCNLIFSDSTFFILSNKYSFKLNSSVDEDTILISYSQLFAGAQIYPFNDLCFSRSLPVVVLLERRHCLVCIWRTLVWKFPLFWVQKHFSEEPLHFSCAKFLRCNSSRVQIIIISFIVWLFSVLLSPPFNPLTPLFISVLFCLHHTFLFLCWTSTFNPW